MGGVVATDAIDAPDGEKRFTPPDADGRMWTIPGAVPPPTAFSTACRFAPRCERASDDCTRAPVPLLDGVRCLHPYDR